MRKRLRPLARYEVGSWVIAQQANSFATTHRWVARELNAEGYQVERHGFDTLRAARAFIARDNR